MTDESVLVNIGEMIDLAIGTPECGVVDFNMLQNVLHCLAQQLKIVGKNVELRGSITKLPYYNQDNAHTVNVTEFQIDLSDSAPGVIKKTEQVLHSAPQPAEETMLVVERVKKPESDRRKSEAPTKAASRTTSYTSTIKSLPAPVRSTEKLSLVTLSKFNMLENVVEDLKSRVYGSTPKNEDILQEVRSQSNVKAITDMWTSLNVSSRLEAAEEAIDKLSSLLQDVIADSTLQLPALKTPPIVVHHPASVTTPSFGVSTMDNQNDKEGMAETYGEDGKDVKISESHVSDARDTLAPTSKAQSMVSQRQDMKGRLMSYKDLTGTVEENIDTLHDEIEKLKYAFKKMGNDFDDDKPEDDFASSTAILTRLNALEKKMQECCESIGKTDGVFSDQAMNFQDQLEGLHKQVGDLTNDFKSSKLSPELVKDFEGIMDLFKTVQEMNEQLKQVHDMATELATEKENRHDHINALLEQIELLKTIKLDREDMAEAIAEKADVRMLARKVSHDQFEMACDDLSRGLEHAFGKLNIQEALWQQALDDIQREFGSKLDKVELSPVKEFFNNKLRQLQENLKQMASLRREVEAAGAKKKLMKDLNCISCDANAVMQMDPGSSVPHLNPLPAHFSIKPYLSYELDTIRKNQAAHVPQRNMHDWENIDKQMQPKQPQRVRSENNKHICNRYCGGSHTVTTPSQRVARVGHFIKQWGPDVVPLSSALAAGDDGRLYKVTAENTDEGQGGGGGGTCTPQTPRKSDVTKPPPTAVSVPECRCLDEDQPTKS